MDPADTKSPVEEIEEVSTTFERLNPSIEGFLNLAFFCLFTHGAHTGIKTQVAASFDS